MKPILIVDDEAIVRDSIRDWLADAGYVAEVAETGEEALAMIARKDFGVLVLDYRLPGKSGVEVLRQAMAIRPQIRSIIITAYPSADLEDELKKLGALDDLLIKPVMVEDLERRVRQRMAALDDSKYGSRSQSNRIEGEKDECNDKGSRALP